MTDHFDTKQNPEQNFGANQVRLTGTWKTDTDPQSLTSVVINSTIGMKERSPPEHSGHIKMSQDASVKLLEVVVCI